MTSKQQHRVRETPVRQPTPARARRSASATQNQVHGNAVNLALSVLMERFHELPQADRDDVVELFQGLNATSDPEEIASIVRALSEIMAQEPLVFIPLPREEEMPPRLAEWVGIVAKNIQEQRKKKRLTQIQLAELSGIPQSYISRLENAEHSATHFTLEKLAKALGINVGTLDPWGD
jgi:predicted XRE-type DNA-binding protein